LSPSFLPPLSTAAFLFLGFLFFRKPQLPHPTRTLHFLPRRPASPNVTIPRSLLFNHRFFRLLSRHPFFPLSVRRGLNFLGFGLLFHTPRKLRIFSGDPFLTFPFFKGVLPTRRTPRLKKGCAINQGVCQARSSIFFFPPLFDSFPKPPPFFCISGSLSRAGTDRILEEFFSCRSRSGRVFHLTGPWRFFLRRLPRLVDAPHTPGSFFIRTMLGFFPPLSLLPFFSASPLPLQPVENVITHHGLIPSSALSSCLFAAGLFLLGYLKEQKDSARTGLPLRFTFSNRRGQEPFSIHPFFDALFPSLPSGQPLFPKDQRPFSRFGGNLRRSLFSPEKAFCGPFHGGTAGAGRARLSTSLPHTPFSHRRH